MQLVRVVETVGAYALLGYGLYLMTVGHPWIGLLAVALAIPAPAVLRKNG